MANLINTIPVRTPQTPAPTAPSVVQPKAETPFENIKNPYPQIKKYEYLPAKPISPARTTPKFTRPVAASGKIINENFFQSATSTVKAYRDYAKNFYNAAFKGEGDDYKVGKINDLSIRAGSLGIASILATTKFFPFAKGMEFIGLGTWFAAMAVWPQLIGAPIKALTGVNINQKYEDSYGRRKGVFEDNQYRPMDLFRHLDENGKLLDEKEYYKKYQYDYVYLDKLADKMGIPKDKKNRHEATMEKMGQVAVQGRTLSMLTAGIMTPVLSSVVADALQTPVKKSLESVRGYKNLKSMNKLDAIINDLDNTNEYNVRHTTTDLTEVTKKLGVRVPEETLNEFTSLVENEFISQEEYKKLDKFFSERLRGTLLEEPVNEYIKNQLSYTEPTISLSKDLHSAIKESSKNTVKQYLSGLKTEVLDRLPEEIKNYEGLSEEEFLTSVKKALSSNGENIIERYKNGEIIELSTQEITSLKNAVARKINESLEATNISKKAAGKIANVVNADIEKALETSKHHNIGQNKDILKQLFKFIETHKSINKEVNRFKRATIENVSESITANNWEKIPPKYLDILGFNKQEITKLATMEPSQASKIISKKFEQIASNNELYTKALKEMSKLASTAIAKEEDAVLTLIGTVYNNGVLTKAKDLMSAVANYNFGPKMEEAIKNIYSNQMKNIQYKLRNTSDSFIRPIKALDTYRYIEESVELILGHNQQEFEQALRNPHFYMFSNMDYAKAKESLKAFIKDIVLDKNDINNWTTKMEHDLPGGKKGMKYSLELIQKIADVVNGPLHHETALIVDADEHKAISNFLQEKQYKNALQKMMKNISEKMDKFIVKRFKLNQIEDAPLTFSQKINLNNSIMRFRFLNLESKLARNFADGTCYMKDYYPAESMLLDICHNKKYDDLYYIKGWLSELREQLPMDTIKELKNIIEKLKPPYDYRLPVHFTKENPKSASLFAHMDFSAPNKAISEMAGKNLTDFLANAAESVRSRNKWTKTAYGLLIATTALTAFVISRVGKDNHFNPSQKDTKPQGAGK